MNDMRILQPYFDGLTQGKLLLPHCRSCGKVHFYPRHACPHCWGEAYDWKPAKGTARVVTHTRVLANPPSAFEHLLPFDIAIVALDEGVSMLTNVVDSASLAVGDELQLDFVQRDGKTLPVFKTAR